MDDGRNAVGWSVGRQAAYNLHPAVGAPHNIILEGSNYQGYWGVSFHLLFNFIFFFIMHQSRQVHESKISAAIHLLPNTYFSFNNPGSRKDQNLLFMVHNQNLHGFTLNPALTRETFNPCVLSYLLFYDQGVLCSTLQMITGKQQTN